VSIPGGGEAPAGRGDAGLAADIRAYLEFLRVERGLAANSLTAYARDLRRYQAYCHDRGLLGTSEITDDVVAKYLAHLTEPDGGAGLSTTSAARMIVAVRGFHRYAAAQGLVGADPGLGVHPPSAPRREQRALSPGEVAAILDCVGGSGAGPLGLRDRALLEFLYGTGARISEAVGLDLADLDLTGQTAVLFGGGRYREVPIGHAATESLSSYLQSGRPALRNAVQPAVFLNARGGRLSRQSAWSVLQSATDRSRIGIAVSPHTLRHSFAAHMLAGGADANVVEYLLGHASAASSPLGGDAMALQAMHDATHPRSRRRDQVVGT
jgi:integrase/recombinase XerD